MSDNQTLALIVAGISIGFSLLCFVGKDLLWEIELLGRKAGGSDKLERDEDFDRPWDFFGTAAPGFAIFVVLYAFLT